MPKIQPATTPAIQSAAQARDALAALSHAQLVDLAKTSGVSFTTLWSIRSGQRKNPGIDTVDRFKPHIAKAATS